MKRYLKISGIVALILGVLFLAHWIIYEAFIVSGVIPNGFVLATYLGSMTIGFIVLSAIGLKRNNFLVNLFYTIFAVWLGVLWYLFFGSVLFWIVYILNEIVKLNLNANLVFEIILMLVTAISVYGLANAANQRITEVKIEIENLPENWKSKKIVFISDIHLGQVNGKRFADKLVKKISRLNADMLLIGGDLFDGVAIDAVDALSPLAKLNMKLGSYFVTGNHEEYRNEEVFIDAVRKAEIKILDNELVEIEGLQIVGVDYKDTAKKENYENILNQITVDPNKPSVLIKHVPSHLEVAHNKFSLQLSGHTHLGQIFPAKMQTRRIFGEFDYGLHQKSKMQVYTSSGVGTWGPPLRVGTKSEIVLIELI